MANPHIDLKALRAEIAAQEKQLSDQAKVLASKKEALAALESLELHEQPAAKN